MAEFLQSKKVLLISPQPWSDIWISKHHYAIELSKKGNIVYFLNPPSSGVKHGSCQINNQPFNNVFVVDYRPLFPMRWKFKFNGLFNFFMRYQVKRIIDSIGGVPDIVWDFEPNRQFADLRWFGAGVNIYHPVDATPVMNSSTKHADVIFSVSDVILDYFRDSQIPRYFINHGLGSTFGEMSRSELRDLNQKATSVKTKLSFGYIGNLLMRYISHDLFSETISRNPDIQFHIWGPYDYSKMTLPEPIASKVVNFIEFLKKSKNVVLYGMQSHRQIMPMILDLDGFFWCYDNEKDPNKGSNSHKLLEYLSTGKVVVSTHVSTYEKYLEQNIIVMSKSAEEYHRRFKDVVSDIQKYNSLSLRTSRIHLALENTYSSHLSYIDSLLTA